MTSCIVPRSRSMPRWGAYPLRSLRTTSARRRTWGHFSVRATPLPLSIWPCAALRPCLPRARYTRRRSEPSGRRAGRGCRYARPRGDRPCGALRSGFRQRGRGGVAAGGRHVRRRHRDPAGRNEAFVERIGGWRCGVVALFCGIMAVGTVGAACFGR